MMIMERKHLLHLRFPAHWMSDAIGKSVPSFWQDDVLVTTEDRASSANGGMMVFTLRPILFGTERYCLRLVSKVRPQIRGKRRTLGEATTKGL